MSTTQATRCKHGTTQGEYCRECALERETFEDYLDSYNEQVDRDYDAMSPDEQRNNMEGNREQYR